MNIFIKRLAAAHYRRDTDLSVCARWRFAEPTPAVIRTAGGSTTEEFYINATLAQLFTLFHAGRSRVVHGNRDINLGGTMRSLGRDGARGVKDPGVKRLHDALLTAATWQELNRALVQIVKKLKAQSAGTPWDSPSWEHLHADLIRWSDTSLRDQVRLEWGQGLVTFAPHDGKGDAAVNRDEEPPIEN